MNKPRRSLHPVSMKQLGNIISGLTLDLNLCGVRVNGESAEHVCGACSPSRAAEGC